MNQMFRRAVFSTAVIGMGTASAARADFNNTNFAAAAKCGGSSFSTCASVSLTWVGNTATVTVTNLGSASDIFTAVGLTGLTEAQARNYTVAVTRVDLGAGIDPTFGWSKGTNGLNGAGIESEVAGAVRSRGGNVNLGLNDGYSLRFVFQFNQTVDRNDVGLAIHAQSGPNGCSTKLVFNSRGRVVNNANSTSYANCGGSSTVPEPATMGLVTTGLLSLGGAGFLKRRKKA